MTSWPEIREFAALSLFFAAIYGLALLGHAYGL